MQPRGLNIYALAACADNARICRIERAEPPSPVRSSVEMMNTAEPEHCAEDVVAVERLTAGQAFHRTVQSAFLTGLTGASGFRERQWRLIQGGRGRVDLAVEVDGDEQMLVIIEIKGTRLGCDPSGPRDEEPAPSFAPAAGLP